MKRDVAQSGSVGALDALGRRFESYRPDQIKNRNSEREKFMLDYLDHECEMFVIISLPIVLWLLS